ncbi:trimethylamine methyltransferase family protein [Sporomusa sphaeroides]|uniref:trimethylamine methyltransferase family protein n=1 Tax=Sporomusa sphaeroides TaxID=47679 RepID=UPI002BBB1F24|nr:trimethylamine methyltransferase family protein [Sporomusa sphaeroides]HML32431.1 trimethylamine methyltransferase family protein [Sporomusa sphaeroides]
MQRYQTVRTEDIEKIHQTSLKIMEEVGVIFSYAPAREILAKGGAKVEGETVYFPKGMVERELKHVPSSFTLHARNPEKNVEFNTEETRFVGPYGAPFVMDLDNGRRPGTLDDFIKLVKLCHMMNNIDVQSHISCEPGDTDADTRHLDMVYNTLKYSDKPLMGSVLGYEAAKENIEMAAIAHGGLDAIKDKPVIISIPCTLAPLSYDDKMAGAIIAYAEYRQPQLVNSLCLAGATSPATIAGSIAVQNAEILAGIVLAQLVSPGTPIVYSASGSSTDMRYGNLSIGAPESALFSLVNGHLAKYYKIPCRISGTLSDSKQVDAQAGYESMMTLLMAQMAGGNFILHSAGILDTYNCVSFEKLMIDDEIIGMVKRIGRGVTVNDETLAFEVAKQVGPRGEYITNKHTFTHFRKEFYQAQLSDRARVNQDGLTIEERANARWKKMLEEYVQPALPEDVDAELQRYIASKR